MIKKITISILFFLFLSFPVMAGNQTASGLTGTDIVSYARYKLNAVSASAVTDPIFSTTELTRWLNDAILDVSKKTGCIQTIESETLIADTIEYALSQVYIEIIGVHLVKSDGSIVALEPGNIRSVGNTDADFKSTKVPRYWYEFDAKIGVYPPYASVTTETVNVYMSIIPSPIVIGAAIPTPSQYDKALVLYIEAQGHKKIGNVNAYTQAMQEYMAELGLDKESNSQAVEETEPIE